MGLKYIADGKWNLSESNSLSRRKPINVIHISPDNFHDHSYGVAGICFHSFGVISGLTVQSVSWLIWKIQLLFCSNS